VSFNLLDERFIPCLLPDGTRQEYGLKDTLLRAHEVRELRDDSPLVTIALHRLLLAILHRNFGPTSLSAWKCLWQGGRFDADRLTAYLERWRGRFDLFDTDRPFYQTGNMSTEKPLPVAALSDELACNNNATLFDHSTNDNGRAASPARAALGLVARQGFALGLGVSPDVTIKGRVVKTGNRKDGPLARGLHILVRGDNLFQTLLCNLTQYSPSEDDVPIWERDDTEPVANQTRSDGRLDLYTFQCRRLRLVKVAPACSEVVQVYFAQGRVPDPGELDPMKPYRRHEKHGWVVFSIDEEKAVWRDSSALLELASDAERPIPALNWLARAAAEGVVPRSAIYNLDTFGVGTQPGKATSVILWRHDRMPLPLAYLDDRGLVEALKTALAIAEDTAKGALRGSVWLTACTMLKPDEPRKADSDRVRALVDSLAPERLYWSRLEVPFRRFLVDLPGDNSQEHRTRMLTAWTCNVLRPAALRAFDESAGQLDHSARVLRAVAVGRRYLGGELARIVRERKITCNSHKEPAHD
jgi:CRISPR system Cascade subunit CasA